MSTTDNSTDKTTDKITDKIIVKKGVSWPGAAAADLLIEDGVITEIGKVSAAGARTIDADGLIAARPGRPAHPPARARPGGRGDIGTGSQAAARGGYTAVLAMANTKPVTDTAEAAERSSIGPRAGLVEVQPVGAVTQGLGAGSSPIGLMAARARRCGSSPTTALRDQPARDAPRPRVRKAFGGVVIQHTEDPDLAGPAAAARGRALRAARPARLAARRRRRHRRPRPDARRIHRRRVHVAHVSTAGTVEVREAKSRGIAVTAEVTPHHLLLTTDVLIGYDPACKVNPPLREEEDVAALREALADGTIDCVATDHAPHARLDKEPRSRRASG